MVGDHHCLACKVLCQHRHQPAPTGRMQPDSILGCETLTAIPDDGEIRHLPPHLLHGEKPVRLAEQAEVGPQDATQEPNAVDGHLVVVQDMDVFRSLLLQLLDQRQVMVIELVVTGHVDHRPVREPLFRPAQAFHTHADIARQDNDISIGCRRVEVLELDVQVVEDVEFHFLILLIANQILALMVVGGDSHEHPRQVTRVTVFKVGGSGVSGADNSGKCLWQPYGSDHIGPLAR